MEDFRVGDKVWTFGMGNGVVTSTDCGESYPINVYFEGEEWDDEQYTAGGLLYTDGKYRSLFHGHDLALEEKLPHRLPKEIYINQHPSGELDCHAEYAEALESRVGSSSSSKTFKVGLTLIEEMDA
ncbi:MAG: hypothetical protein GY799_21110 [Desulfobulbaceae bacterium]|nr:hypothetical protein [Desulfobulbaceae bacterium]